MTQYHVFSGTYHLIKLRARFTNLETTRHVGLLNYLLEPLSPAHLRDNCL